MAKSPSNSRSKPRTKPAARAAKPASRPSAERIEVAAAARAPTPTDAQRSAFRKQFSEADCEARGTRTSSAAVLRDVRGWIPIIERNLADHGAQIR